MRRATTRKRRRRDRRRRRRRRRRFSRSEFFDSNASRHVQLGCFLRANKTRFKAFFIVVVLSSRRRHHRATMAATRVILEDVRGRRRHDDPLAAARSFVALSRVFFVSKRYEFSTQKHRKHKDASASAPPLSALVPLLLLLQPSTARGETVRIVLQNERFEKTVRGSVFEPLGVQRVRSKTSPRRSESSRGATKLDRTDRVVVFVREEQRHDV